MSKKEKYYEFTPTGIALMRVNPAALPAVVRNEAVQKATPTTPNLMVAPNPTNPVANISFTVPEGRGAQKVRLEIYDVHGTLLSTLVHALLVPGDHRVAWNGEGCSSGVYLVRYTCDRQTLHSKLTLLH